MPHSAGAAAVVVTPDPASAVGAVVAPGVVLGSVTITPTDASAIGATVAPTVVYGSVTISPTPASAIGAVYGPTVLEGEMILEPSPVEAVASVSGPTVVLGDTTATPDPAAAVGATVAPTVIQGSVTVSTTPASAIGAVVAPTVVLGSVTATPAAVSAIGAVYGPQVIAGGVVGDYVDVYSSALNAGFSGAAGSLFMWCKVSSGDEWTDGQVRYMVLLSVDSNNQVYIRKSSTNNQIEYGYIAGGTAESVAKAAVSETGWFTVGITWDKTAEEVRAFYNGVQEGATQTGLGSWSGDLASSGCVIGASDNSGTSPWKGYLGHVALWDKALSEMQGQWLSNE